MRFESRRFAEAIQPWTALLLLGLLAAAVPLHAATTYQFSTGGGNWNADADWTPNTGYPQAGDTAGFQNNPNSGQAVYLNGNQSCATLQFYNMGFTLHGGTNASPNTTDTLTVSTLVTGGGGGGPTIGIYCVLAGSCGLTWSEGSNSLQFYAPASYTGMTTITNAGAAIQMEIANALPG